MIDLNALPTKLRGRGCAPPRGRNLHVLDFGSLSLLTVCAGVWRLHMYAFGAETDFYLTHIMADRGNKVNFRLSLRTRERGAGSQDYFRLVCGLGAEFGRM